MNAPLRAVISLRSKHIFREAITLFGAFIAIYVYASLFSYQPASDAGASSNLGGHFGGIIAHGLLVTFGNSAFLITALLVYALWNFAGMLRDKTSLKYILPSALIGLLLLLISTCGIEALRMYSNASELPFQRSGGIVGLGVAKTLYDALGFHGASLILIGLWASSLSLFAMFSWLELCDKLGVWLGKMWQVIKKQASLIKQMFDTEHITKQISRTQASRAQQNKTRRSTARKRATPAPSNKTAEPSLEGSASDVAKQPATSSLTLADSVESDPPSGQLLTSTVSEFNSMTDDELRELAQSIEGKLAEFGIQATVEEILPGPVVTRYEIQPASGVKGSQITNLVRDLSRTLSVSSIRVLESIPGKTTMGLEVPNSVRKTVTLGEVINSPEFENSDSCLSLGLGKDIAGNVVVADLAAMPHLLVAGTTGSGKSVQINSMILSILYKASPHQVRMILIDPKIVELAPFDGLPHLLSPVISDMNLVPSILNWAVEEMERRYRLMAKLSVRNLGGMNEAIAGSNYDREQLGELAQQPHIVIVIDELADLMAVVGKKVEQLIARLAQKARAAGIHLILATQRPSVDVITGLIKANVPARIAFQVSSRIDSRTILDQGGAETLLGKGDMLYLPGGYPVPIRIHGAFVDDKEVGKVTTHVRSSGLELEQIDFQIYQQQSQDKGSSSDDNGERDEFFNQAVELVLDKQRISISMIQRHLRIGYNRAARLVEDMEAAGIVTPMDASGSRNILVSSNPEDSN